MHDDLFSDVYPELTDEERRIARDTLDRYLELAWEIYHDAHARDA